MGLCAGGQSTIASASSSSSLRKQWIPQQVAGGSEQPGEPAQPPTEDSNLSLGYVPPTVALAVFVHEPIYAQYRLTSRMCMHIARGELQLLRVTQVLQDVLLGGRTTVVNAVMDSIKHQLRVHQEVRAARLQEDLQDAAAEVLSACESPGADALHGLQFGCATTHPCEGFSYNCKVVKGELPGGQYAKDLQTSTPLRRKRLCTTMFLRGQGPHA